jgi:hypothetical protein
MVRHRKVKSARRQTQCEGLKVSQLKSFHLQLIAAKMQVDVAGFIGLMRLSSQWSMNYHSVTVIEADC